MHWDHLMDVIRGSNHRFGAITSSHDHRHSHDGLSEMGAILHKLSWLCRDLGYGRNH